MKTKLIERLLIAGVIAIFAFGVLFAYGHDKPYVNPMTASRDAFGAGVTSIPLREGTEQIIRFDKHGAARITLEPKDHTPQIKGKIDYVLLRDVKREDGASFEQMDVLLSNRFVLDWQPTEKWGTMELVSAEIKSEPGSKDTEIYSQSVQLPEQKYFKYNEPLRGTLAVRFANSLYNVNGDYHWNYAVTLDEQGQVTLSLEGIECAQE